MYMYNEVIYMYIYIYIYIYVCSSSKTKSNHTSSDMGTLGKYVSDVSHKAI